jgi:hypothetical protein
LNLPASRQIFARRTRRACSTGTRRSPLTQSEIEEKLPQLVCLLTAVMRRRYGAAALPATPEDGLFTLLVSLRAIVL